METGGLKSFAGEARRQLLSEVRARLELVLAEGSTQRREYADVVRKLESAVDHAGGGEAGRVAVVDRVAYTWFNRIVALRFMDANGFTDVGVVSPADDRPDGQPEVLVDAKRGVMDTDVVAVLDEQRIAGLLSGSVTSHDPESEAFGLLLAAYCRFWNKSMPFMFEHSADYTELLMPADLLSDESVIARAVTVLTTDVCADVEVIGWLYQFYIAEKKDEVFAGFKKGKKAGAAEIPAATQLFTPDWIVRYLVENSLGRLWMLNRPDSTLVGRMEYYIAPVDEETEFLRIETPEEIKVMDPACGSGHMLTYAFDLLYAMYEEDGYNPLDIPALVLSKNLYGTEIDQRAGALAAFALTMKARARQRTFFTKKVSPNICVLEPVTFSPDELGQLVSRSGDRDAEEAFWLQYEHADTRGSLTSVRRPQFEPDISRIAEREAGAPDLFAQSVRDRAQRVLKQWGYLKGGYSIVIANPPYSGLGNLSDHFATWAKHQYPNSKTDLYSMFIERAFGLVVPNGQVAMVTMQSWMFLRYFEGLRDELLRVGRLLTMAHLGTRAFDSIGGEVVGTTAFVFSREIARPLQSSTVARLVDGRSESEKSAQLRRIAGGDRSGAYQLELSRLHSVPGKAFLYWATDRDFELFEADEPVGAHIETRVGLITGDNEKFLRRWYEVSLVEIEHNAKSTYPSPCRWFPYVKGGEYRRWAGNYEFVVNWYRDGAEVKRNIDVISGRVRAHNFNGDYAFREGFTWSGISSNGFAVRQVPPGFMFDTKGPMGFAVNPEELLVLQGLLNSVVVRRYMRMLAPTLDFNLGHVMAVPFVDKLPSEFAQWAQECIDIAWNDWNSRETSRDFSRPAVFTSPALGSIEQLTGMALIDKQRLAERTRVLEELMNRSALEAYGLPSTEGWQVGLSEVTLQAATSSFEEGEDKANGDIVREVMSYAVGCMFGRYSLDETGLILANQADTLQEYLERIPEPSFMPDEDNVIPVLADDWFDDDIVERFRLFLRVAFGEEYFEENLRFVEESLGKDIRRYFLTDFYKDHVRRYKKRPIYWMFSSPKGAFNALIYMHRYTPSTVSTVLNEYLREFQAKLDAELANQARIAADPSASARDKARAEKESDKIRKTLAELKDYEHDVLYPLASRQISIDLDDGVKANYPKFGTALKKIPGLEAADD